MTREVLRNGLGGRIAAIRGARRMKQDDLAQAANVSLSMLRKIEQGARVPSDHVLDAIAVALGVDPARLLGKSGRLDGRVHDAIPVLRKVIATYDVPDEGPVRPMPALRASVAGAVQKRLSAQYIRLAQTLPGLLGELIRGVHTATNPDDTAALLVATYRAADAVAYKYGYLDLSARLIELMRQTSATAEDPLLSASTAYVRTEVFFAAHTYHAGLRAIESAIDCLPEKAGRLRLGVLGSLHMRAAVIAARAANADAAMSHLSEARRLGDLVPEDIYYGTAFGPSSVRVHEVSVALGLGDRHLQLALALGENWSPPLEMPAERRSGFFIDLARAQLWAGLKDAAFESLKTARRIAPQHTREHPWVREDAETLLRLHRANSESLISFAEWAGVV
ncbi:helix-turn-helix domain-containing protein [Streptosporangium minutum]|uniref:Transcriptional regulator n=1 Tax=Streptosporangium minutum TaxID=569862 RepID=A0A243QQ40_9ACTN|nr:helix-turn-helix transcriptional regulator [Streptosporangium minutum]OUC83322.1 transcriptional regulator [Streptosporangium minutum]